MRISPSVLRNAATNPSYRVPVVTPGVQQGGPSTDGPLRTAIRTYHESGPEEARLALASSLASTYWKSGAGLTMSTQARACLETYIRRAAGDPRSTFPGSRRSWFLDDVEFTVNPDVIVFGHQGYEPRLCLQGPLARPLTRVQRVLIAAPTIFAVAEEMDGGYGQLNVVGAEVWELRSGAEGGVSREEAERAVDDLRALAQRIASA